MPAFTSTCRCCNERLVSEELDTAWSHFRDHADDDHDARFRRTAMTRAHAVAGARGPDARGTRAD